MVVRLGNVVVRKALHYFGKIPTMPVGVFIFGVCVLHLQIFTKKA